LFVVDTSRDEEFARKLFGDLICDILRPPGDGKIIIIDDSDDDNEAQEEGTTGIDPIIVPASIADAPAGEGSLIVMIRGPSRRPMMATTADVALVSLRL
jgi:hypothetical protein